MVKPKFYLKLVSEDKQMIWIVDPIWVQIISFLLGLGLLVLYEKYKQHRLNYVEKNKKKNSPDDKKIRGGGLEKCFEPDKIYEVTDSSLKMVIRQMYNHFSNNQILFVPPAVVILAKFIACDTQIFQSYLMHGPTKMVSRKILGTLVEVGLTLPSYRTIFFGILPLFGSPLLYARYGYQLLRIIKIGGLVTITMVGTLTAVEQHSEKFCNDLLQIQPSDKVQERVITYANQQEITPGSIFVKGNPDLVLYQKKEKTIQPNQIKRLERRSDSTCQMLSEFTVQNCEQPNQLTLEEIEILGLDKSSESPNKLEGQSYRQKYLEFKAKKVSFEEIQKHNDNTNLRKTKNSKEAYEKKVEQYQRNKKQLRIEDKKS